MSIITSLNNLDITTIKGVGARMAETLAKLGICTVQDLLFHLPIRYLDRTRITPISQLRTDTSVVVSARVLKCAIVFGRRRSLAVTIEDATGKTTLRFYHFNAAQKNSFEPGRAVRCFGDPRLGSSGVEFYHPEYEFLDQSRKALHEETLTPVYSLTEGLSQQRLRKMVESAVSLLDEVSPDEFLPPDINANFNVASLSDALRFLHFPPPNTSTDAILCGQHPSQMRLAFEELLAHFLVRQQLKARAQAQRGPLVKGSQEQVHKLIAQLPFTPTAAQLRVADEIGSDFKQGIPMLRMVQGDVGSGKTLVAAIAAVQVISAGYQVAVAAPTEILAEQHFRSFSQWLTPLDISVVLLIGKLKASEKRQLHETISSGEKMLVVGTHALFQDSVDFLNLGLAVIDEQHRFGVEQRRSLRKKNKAGEVPHQMVMTATPIPRTLAMTAYSDLDYSVIDELPPGRIPIQTALVSQAKRDQVIERIRHACTDGAQVYWVCPLVEDSETLSAANAEETAEYLKKQLPELEVKLVHGRMKSNEKETQMADFKSGEAQILVATTVIEVGVDVPNASLMIIENPERLGLAQLHQLRGRVGRGNKASHCVLLYGLQLSQQARERLQVLRESSDGFVIAEKDLELRGPGELLGTRQTGDMQYRVANVQQHNSLIPAVHQLGRKMMANEDQSIEALIARWVGNKKHYAQV